MENIRKVLQRYLANRANPTQKKQVDDWYAKMDEKDLLRLPDHQWQQIEDAIWNGLEPKLYQKTVIRSLGIYLKVAACLLLVSGITAWIIIANAPTGNKQTSVLTYQEFRTGLGERKQLKLADSTTIVLNSASRIRVYDDFSTKRMVDIIDGQAFFDVHHNPSSPFLINTGGVTVRVLGTAFDIKAYAQLKQVVVAVTRGKVSVKRGNSNIAILVKNQQLVYQTDSRLASVQKFSSADILAWQNGNIFFSNTGFAEASLMLHNQYGIALASTDKAVRNKKFTAVLPITLSAHKAVEVLASIHHLKIKQRRDTIELTK